MKGRIEDTGNLLIQRGNKEKQQYCPLALESNSIPCGDWCPSFGEPELVKYYTEDPKEEISFIQLRLCQRTLAFNNFTDEREQFKPQKKVKKWLWVVEGSTVIHGPYTETEIKNKFQIQRKWYHKIDETEIEE